MWLAALLKPLNGIAWSNHLEPSGHAALGVHDYAYKPNLAPVASASKIVKDGRG